MHPTRLLLIAAMIALSTTGCAWWKKNVTKRDDAEEQVGDDDFDMRSTRRTLTERSSLPGGWSSEARAIEANLGVQ